MVQHEDFSHRILCVSEVYIILTKNFAKHADMRVPIFGKHLFPYNAMVCGSNSELSTSVRNHGSLGYF